MEETYFGLWLVNSFVAALGDVLLLAVFFGLFRIRSPRLRRALLATAILHCCLALAYLSPWTLISLDVVHSGHAPWYSTARRASAWATAS